MNYALIFDYEALTFHDFIVFILLYTVDTLYTDGTKLPARAALLPYGMCLFAYFGTPHVS